MDAKTEARLRAARAKIEQTAAANARAVEAWDRLVYDLTSNGYRQIDVSLVAGVSTKAIRDARDRAKGRAT